MTCKILIGDCRAILASLPSESVDCVVTSPPYYSQRDYSVEPSAWGGDPECEHVWGAAIVNRSRATPGVAGSGLTAGGRWQSAASRFEARSNYCGKCGAWHGVLGLEPTLDEYIEHLVEIFEEIRRVLKRHGTLWLNIGDGYAGGGQGGGGNFAADRANWRVVPPRSGQRAAVGGLKPKDRMMVPARVAIALQAAGWWLRDDIVWWKPNSMPESVVDRTTKAHEAMFLLAKSGKPTCWLHEDGRWAFSRPPADFVWRHAKSGKESAKERKGKGWRRVNRWGGRDYYYDQDAIAEPVVPDTPARYERGRSDDHKWADGGPGGQTIAKSFAHMKRSGNKERKPASARGVPVDPGGKTYGAMAGSIPWEGSTRNKRSVWPITTRPMPDAHFATYPPALVEPCILAGCPADGVVLDPFGGAGTTGLVAERLGRDSIMIELNREYAAIARRRIRAGRGVVRTDLPEPEAEHGPLFGSEGEWSK